jgi:hypothetical protein
MKMRRCRCRCKAIGLALALALGNFPRSLIYRNPRERICSVYIPSLLSIYLSYITGFDIKIVHQIIYLNHMLITLSSSSSSSLLQYWHYVISIMSHGTLIIYYHASMLTLQTSSISHALRALIWGRLECIINQHLVGSIQHAASCICWWESALRLRWDEMSGSAEAVWDLEKAKILEGYYEYPVLHRRHLC